MSSVSQADLSGDSSQNSYQVTQSKKGIGLITSTNDGCGTLADDAVSPFSPLYLLIYLQPMLPVLSTTHPMAKRKKNQHTGRAPETGKKPRREVQTEQTSKGGGSVLDVERDKKDTIIRNKKEAIDGAQRCMK